MTVLVRAAGPGDASVACGVVRHSIAELCIADHEGDARTIDAWLANKTQENFVQWICSPRHAAFVAEWSGAFAGFALLNKDGTLALLYVAPKQRFTGVSDALLAAVERHALAIGIAELRLHSSGTALRFYERRGYRRDGDPVPGFGITRSHPMRKRLLEGLER